MLDALLAFWFDFIAVLRWTVPVTLMIVALVQVMYLGYLNVRANQGERQARPRRQPDAPIMPTNPADSAPPVNAPPPPPVPIPAPSPQRRPELSVPTGRFQGKMMILSGLPNINEIEMPGEQFAIGRFYNPDQNVLVSLDERSVSRRHARFEFNRQTGECFLSDTNSSYGTTIRKGEDFHPITPNQPERVYNGDVVQFGSAVTVRLVLPGEQRGSVTTV